MGQKTSESWLTLVVIAVVGFLTGFFFVYLLRGGGQEQGPPPPEAAAAADPSAGAAATGDEDAAPAAPTEQRQQALTGGGGAEGRAAGDEPTAAAGDGAGAESASKPSQKADEPDPQAERAVLEQAPVAAAAAEAASDPDDPWTSLLGKPCTLHFGKLQAVVVRQGELRHGQEVLWKRDIGGRPRIGRVARDEAATVVPLAFGFHPSGGRPSAAYVRIQSGQRQLDGVIALKVADELLELRPQEQSGEATGSR